jgi:small-conductance mechanosensitive channel
MILPSGEMNDTYGFSSFNSLIEGKVINSENGLPLDNFTVSFSAPFFDTTEVKTNASGEYRIELPSKNFTISIYNTIGELVNRTNFYLDHETQEYLAFSVDPSRPLKANIKGKVLDKDGEGIDGATVSFKMKNKHYLCCNFTTDKEGDFVGKIEPGDYLVQVYYEDKLEYEGNFTLLWGIEYSFEFETDISISRPILTLEETTDFLEDHWIDIIFLLISLIIIIFLYAVFMAGVTFFKKRKVKFLESDWFSIARTFIIGLTLVGILLVLSYQIANMFPDIEEYSWDLMKQIAGPAIGIMIIIFISRLLLHANKDLWDRWKVKKKSPTKSIPQQLISMISIIIRYLIILISLVLVVVLILSAFGLRQEILDVVGNFLTKNGGKLGFLVILIIAAFFIKKFVDIFFKEIGSRSTKMSPQIVSMTQKGTTILVYFVITLIFLYTLLSIGGLGDIGTTFILVISMIIGLVVSFAATGSIGNMLSGLVLMSMKPFDIGDRVMVGENIGFVQKMGIMFTTLKDLENRILEIPNNNVLANDIMNFTRSAKDGGYAVVVDVGLGYDLSPKTVRPLLKRAALTSPGVLKEQVPKVIVRDFLDHAVVYRLRAYIDDPTNMLFIRSSVMESILMIFHEEGLQVMSPLQHVKVEGKAPTEEELIKRAHPEQKIEEAAEGLTMFDNLEDG